MENPWIHVYRPRSDSQRTLVLTFCFPLYLFALSTFLTSSPSFLFINRFIHFLHWVWVYDNCIRCAVFFLYILFLLVHIYIVECITNSCLRPKTEIFFWSTFGVTVLLIKEILSRWLATFIWHFYRHCIINRLKYFQS